MRFKNLDLNLLVALNYFLTERNVSRAAEKMFISQSAASNALSRLRLYFNDEILVQVGKQMELTPRALELVEPVRNILVSIESQIIHQDAYDPIKQKVKFSISVSDYTLSTLVPKILQYIESKQYLIELDFQPQSFNPIKTLDQGDADLLIIPQNFISENHPSEVLFAENFVCIASKNHPTVQTELSLKDFKQQKHIIMQPDVHTDSYESQIIKSLKIKRDVAVTSYNFSIIPELIAKSHHLAILHKSLALKFQQFYEINIFELPFDLPEMKQSIQWHRLRKNDARIIFFIEMLQKICQKNYNY
ncbi:LysR family transcriptional regulator [Acinetobacter gerneri]|uniref:LysR family transcriptional regulator n=1 Tax=Acinetobacter gerneri TaxID=202952 RepID=A0AAW8JLI0_9GAMM|nr:LysR family transcriptional regulator [Acinetobacter gerneri]MDQ9011604.1 LysR family transcriptional regulator [Acinetobacter gerneri]MDQ9015738.1 LysR family transcriptional regulator [Acinetobacter gerneri]MDQ9026909.1 LysR family transcriptional regulator [Acinetobacter gerneri]MDQ9054192.1 LysR family transcriptional regulator [Acinetobacter gerneri]MDQ9061871.1 LysR family transcriptional regulator [Acinetobacter gerneri]